MSTDKKAPKLGDQEKTGSQLARMYAEESRKPPTPDEIAKAVQPQVGYEDMTKMEDMNEVTLLANVKERYNADLMYTYCSAILVAMNPFKFLPVYTQAWVVRYKGHRLGIQHPHLYAIAESAYSTMADRHQDVSVIVSGESGAGKTECTKLVLRFLAARMDKLSKTENMLLETVPILDVLGNAKTVRNDNSSRFGKYIEIIFDQNNFIAGSKITHYLLEKSRITWQAEGERNFHFFYQITEGAGPEDRELFKSQPANNFKMLSMSGCISIPKLDEAEDLKSTKRAFTLFGISKENQTAIFKLVSGVLWLGNLAFKTNDRSVSVIDGKESEIALENAASLFNIPKEDLLAGIRTRHLIVRGEKTIVELIGEKSKDAADALAKTLYAYNFDWVIKKINESLFADKYTSKNFIGVLDIFGFENFKFNSLEQLLINFANEKLQKFFNHHIFSMEQEEYEREQIDWKSITFKDNQECLDLIEKKPTGILPYLDEECRFPKASDKSFLEKINQNCDKHPNFQKLKIVRTTFKVLHYAGLVEYDVTGWLEKNKDELPDHTIELLQTCKNPYLNELFKPDPEALKAAQEAAAAGGAARKKGDNRLTVSARFRNSLNALNDKMMATAPYFVRCIKPNMTKNPNEFVSDFVNEQLKYAGMLETIRIRRLGYPIRYVFKEFYQRFKCLVHSQHHSSGDFEARISGMLPHINLAAGQFQKGLTKVFLKQEASNIIEDRRAVKLGEVIFAAQCWYRMISLRKEFKEKRAGSLVIESWFRARYGRKTFLEDRDAAIRIQNMFRVAKAVNHKKALLEKKRKEEEEIRRKKEEERQRKIAAGKMTAEQAREEAEREAKMEMDELLNAVKKGKKKEKGMRDEHNKAEQEALDKDLLAAGPAIEIADTTIYCPNILKVGLKWSSEKVVDLDISAICLDKNGFVLDVCYYNQKETGDNAVKLDQDDRLGEKVPGDNEAITIDFTKISQYVRFIGLMVNVYSDGYSFVDTQSPVVELRDGSKVLFSAPITEDNSKAIDGKTGKHTAFIPALLLKGEKWVCNPAEKLCNGMRWMESLSFVQKLLVDAKMCPPIDGERPFPKPFRSIKGEEIVITSNVTKLMCGLGWVGNEDLDLAVLMFRYKEFVDHIDPVRHNKSRDGSVFHKGDAKVGKGTDDERIYVDLSDISRRVNELFFLVTVFNAGGGGGFAKVREAHVRLVDATTLKDLNDPDKEITRFLLSRSCGNRSAQIMCKLWRVGPSKWNVIAMGEPSTGLFYEHLIPKVQPFLDDAPPNRVLKVTIHNGKNLPADLLPYFRVRFDRDSQKTTQHKKLKQKYKEVVFVTGEANAMDIGIYHKTLAKDKFYGQIFVPFEPTAADIKKKYFKLEDRGKKKEKIASGSELCVSVENVTNKPEGEAILKNQKPDKKK